MWDARLTSELILLFLYLGFMALQAAIDDPRRADKAGAVLALVGVVNVPIIYFSVQWWNTLHQGASVSITRAPSMATTMLAGMLVMALAFWMYSIAVALHARALHHPRARATDRVGARTPEGRQDQVNWGSWDNFCAMGGYGFLRLGLVRGGGWRSLAARGLAADGATAPCSRPNCSAKPARRSA